MTPKDEHDASRDLLVASLADAPRLGEHYLRLILDAIPAPVCYVDSEKRYRFNNRAFDSWLGRPHVELPGLHIREAMGESAYAEVRPYVERALAGEEVNFEREIEYPNGERRFVSVSYMPDRDAAGRVRGFVSLVKDMTERRRGEESLRFHSQLLDTVEQAVIATDLTGKITYWNRHAGKLYGWRAGEAVGRNVVDMTPAATTREQAAEIMSRLIAGETWSGEFLVRRRDGTTFPAQVTDTPLYDDGGNLVGVVGVSEDISERKRAERAVREAERRALREYQTLLQRLTVLAESLGTARDHLTIFRDLRDFAVVSVPCAGVFISFYDEERGVRVAKYAWGDGEEVETSTLPPMPVASEGPNSEAVWTRRVVITNDYWEMRQKGRGQRSVLIGPDNGLRPQSSLVVPMATMGRIVGTIEVQSYENHAYRDEHVTAMKMAANLAAVAIENMRLLQFETRARAAAEESNRMKDEFLATLSHELRTPLTAILGWSSMMRDSRLDEKTRATAIEIIERNARMQQQIIDDILDVSRIITGQLRFEAEPTDLRRVVEAAADTVRPAALAKNIDLRVSLEPGVGPVMAEPRRLQQVVWNILSNAVKFTPAGGEVRVLVEREGEHARVVVSDNGLGIAPEFLPHVFDRFRQADMGTTRAHGGLGLGLSIVRHLVELHGGTVRAASEGAGRGSTFTVEIPLLRDADFGSPIEGEGSEGGEQSEIRNPKSATLLRGLRVLVVDDEHDSLDLVRAILERRGASVTAVGTTEAAWAALETEAHDLMLCDIGLPGEDGYQFIRRVREGGREHVRATPAVALTAYASDADREQALEAGFHLHVPKPVDAAGLLSAIAGLVGKNRG